MFENQEQEQQEQVMQAITIPFCQLVLPGGVFLASSGLTAVEARKSFCLIFAKYQKLSAAQPSEKRAPGIG